MDWCRLGRLYNHVWRLEYLMGEYEHKTPTCDATIVIYAKHLQVLNVEKSN